MKDSTMVQKTWEATGALKQYCYCRRSCGGEQERSVSWAWSSSEGTASERPGFDLAAPNNDVEQGFGPEKLSSARKEYLH